MDGPKSELLMTTCCIVGCRFNAQHTAHSQLLASFSDQLASLEAMALHPALQTERYRRLSDFSAAQRAREWADSCRRSHAHFAQKV
jgi:hypothetical protein